MPLPSRPGSPQSAPVFQANAAAAASSGLGDLPEWNLADLYASPDCAEFASDLEKARTDATAFKEAYQGKLSALASDGAKLADAIRAYEALAELMGRIGSFAGLHYTGDQADPARAKFYGDTSAQLTEIYRELIFVELELNEIDEAVMATALQTPTLAHYGPWLADLRKEKPFQLDEKLERLFTDKSQTAGGAWNRLFSDTMADLRFDVDGEAEPLTLEPTLNLMLDASEATPQGRCRSIGQDVPEQHPLIHADHEHPRQGQADLGRVARL